MLPTSHFKTRLNDLGTTMKLRAFVSDQRLRVHFLDRSIHDEEQWTDILDLANIAYPILARTLRAGGTTSWPPSRCSRILWPKQRGRLRQIMSRARRKAGRRHDEEIRRFLSGRRRALIEHKPRVIGGRNRLPRCSLFSTRTPQRYRNEMGETTVNKTRRKHLLLQEKSIT